MQCFRFAGWDRERDADERRAPATTTAPARSLSARSNSSTASTDRDVRRSESDFSLNASELSSASSLGRCRQLSLSQRPANTLRVFTLQELRSATRGFSRALMLGEGGFGCVYRGAIRAGGDRRSVDVAIKQLGRKGLQGHKEWMTEVNVLGVVDHPNLVKLIGYCAEDDERGMQLLLVYEFMPNRSLADHLSPRSPRPVSWAMRLRVALDTARGLKYLHEESEFKIIFRDLKPSNILLDENWNAKLSDFGLARLGPQEGSHVSTAVVGTIGYAAPEYIHTGRLSTKNDIWSYGVVLYELLTGRRPLDRNRPRSERNLVEWVRPYSSDAKKLETVIDPRLQGSYSIKAAAKLASVANKCLARQARYRPKMGEVLEMVQKIVDSSELGTPEHPLAWKKRMRPSGCDPAKGTPSLVFPAKGASLLGSDEGGVVVTRSVCCAPPPSSARAHEPPSSRAVTHPSGPRTLHRKGVDGKTWVSQGALRAAVAAVVSARVR